MKKAIIILSVVLAGCSSQIDLTYMEQENNLYDLIEFKYEDLNNGRCDTAEAKEYEQKVLSIINNL